MLSFCFIDTWIIFIDERIRVRPLYWLLFEQIILEQAFLGVCLRTGIETKIPVLGQTPNVFILNRV